VQKLDESTDWDGDRVEVRVEEGHVLLEGRVGTEQELQQIEQIVTDVLGLHDVSNDIVVDPLVRGERSQAADIAATEDARGAPILGEGAHNTSDTAAHLVDDTEHEHFGTSDPREATERGFSYNPPDGRTQEGTRSRENH
jgi:hypothetical protein